MKLIFSIMFLWLAASMATAQNCDLKVREVLSQLDYQLDIIDSLTYVSVTPFSDSYERQEFNEKPETDLVKQYPEIFLKEDDCYKFHDGREPQYVCPLDTTKDMKEYSRYEFLGVYCNQILIYRQGYEWADYLSVDLSDGKALTFYGKPITYNCQTALTYGQIYSETGIAVTDIQSRKKLTIEVEGWEVSESKQTIDEFYLQLERQHIECLGQKKYIRIKLK